METTSSMECSGKSSSKRLVVADKVLVIVLFAVGGVGATPTATGGVVHNVDGMVLDNVVVGGEVISNETQSWWSLLLLLLADAGTGTEIVSPPGSGCLFNVLHIMVRPAFLLLERYVLQIADDSDDDSDAGDDGDKGNSE